LPFDTVLTGELAHSFKPSPSVYQLAVDYLGFRPDEIMMVACHKYDLKGAKAFGFWTAFLPRPLEFGPGATVSTSPEPYIDVMATDLVDLAAKLGA
jgi:2-haloacid dehalogenase